MRARLVEVGTGESAEAVVEDLAEAVAEDRAEAVEDVELAMEVGVNPGASTPPPAGHCSATQDVHFAITAVLRSLPG